MGTLPVFTRGEEELPAFRLFTTQLIVDGAATEGEIVRAFGVPAITVKRSVKRYRTAGAEVHPDGQIGIAGRGRAPWHATMPKFSFPPRETRLRVLRFGVVGVGTALLQVAFVAGLKLWMSDTLAFSLSWALSAAVHYAANRFWALPSTRRDSAKQLGEYLVALAVSYGINLGAFKVCRDGLGMSVEWATLWAIPPSTIVVFLILNYRVFRATRA